MEITLQRFKSRKRKKRRPLRIHKLRMETAVSVKQLRKKLDTLFHAYIRKRDGKCMMATGWGGCNGPIQAGHVISRRHLATRWDDTNVFGQCRSHNYQHTFNPNLYISWYVTKYGPEKYESLVRKSRTVFRPTRRFLLEEIRKVEEKLSLLG